MFTTPRSTATSPTPFRTAGFLIATVTALAAATVHAQVDLSWRTIDGGGGSSAGGTLVINGTIGQPDAGTSSTASYVVTSGFWPVALPACYANCDNSTAAPILNVNDFICFQSRFAAGDPYANCDGSTAPPILNVNDFICFQSHFAAGCP